MAQPTNSCCLIFLEVLNNWIKINARVHFHFGSCASLNLDEALVHVSLNIMRLECQIVPRREFHELIVSKFVQVEPVRYFSVIYFLDIGCHLHFHEFNALAIIWTGLQLFHICFKGYFWNFR